MPTTISRRNVLTSIGSCLALVACGENKIGETVIEAAKLQFGSAPKLPLDRAAISNLPYASIKAKIGRGPEALLILWRFDAAGHHWLSADDVAIVTDAGRVVQSAGLPETLRSTESRQVDPLVLGLHDKDMPVRHFRTVTLQDKEGGRNEFVIHSSFTRLERAKIQIAEIDFDTIRIEENCIATTVNWSFKNTYWVDPADGFVWKSQQHIARSYGPLTIEVLKPPA